MHYLVLLDTEGNKVIDSARFYGFKLHQEVP